MIYDLSILIFLICKQIRNTFEVNHLKHMYLLFNYKILIKLSSL